MLMLTSKVCKLKDVQDVSVFPPSNEKDLQDSPSYEIDHPLLYYQCIWQVAAQEKNAKKKLKSSG